jgi:hypothetical protein
LLRPISVTPHGPPVGSHHVAEGGALGLVQDALDPFLVLAGEGCCCIPSAVHLVPELLAGELASPEAGGELHPGGNLLLAGLQALFPDGREIGDLALGELQLFPVAERRLGADRVLTGLVSPAAVVMPGLLGLGRAGQGQPQAKREQGSERHVTTSVSV